MRIACSEQEFPNNTSPGKRTANPAPLGLREQASLKHLSAGILFTPDFVLLSLILRKCKIYN
jgi:hypothetical protein